MFLPEYLLSFAYNLCLREGGKEMTSPKIVILHNIISPYKTELFNALNTLLGDLEVVYIAENEHGREWTISRDGLKFPYQIMFAQPIESISPILLYTRTWKCLNELNPEIIIIDGYSYSSCWAGLIWAKYNGKRTILLSSSTWEDHPRSFIRESVKKTFVAFCNAFYTYGIRSRDYLIRLGAEAGNITMIGNNTDNSFYFAQTSALKRERHALTKELAVAPHNFLYIGRFAAEKNITMLLKAYREFKLRGDKRWGLILVGNGPLKEEITKFIRAANLSDVLMPGFVQKAYLSQFFAVSDVFVLPSLSEPWGLVVNETMAAGLPVLISTNCGCYPNLVKEGSNGFGFDPNNVDGLAMLMHDFAGGKYDLESMGRMSLEIISKYTPQNAAALISKTIDVVKRYDD